MTKEPVKFSVTITDKSGQWFNGQIGKMNSALGIMANTILKESQAKVPRKSGSLAKNARVVIGSKKAAVIYPAPYGGYQERGQRYDGTHKVRNYTTPGTGKHYLEDTGKKVTERGIRWFLSHS